MHFGSPSLLAGASDLDSSPTRRSSDLVVCFTHAVQPSADVAMVGPTTPLVVRSEERRVGKDCTESAKYASSAETRFRRSDFIEARYAFSFVLANFGIAMAAKIPMITTT